jgi:hypothetical protein
MPRALVILVLLSTTAHAQLAPIKNVQQECVVLGCVRYSSYGSAVAVAHSKGGTVFLTAAHNLDPKSDTSRMVSLMIAGSPAVIKGQWKDNKATDLALLWVPNTLYERAMIERTPPQVGEQVIAGGFDFARVSGQPTGTDEPVVRYYETKVQKAQPKEFGETDRSWPVGMSGGSLVRPGGGIVGIICHSSGFNINYDLAAFVTSHFPDAKFAPVPPPPVNTSGNKPLKILPDAPPPEAKKKVTPENTNPKPLDGVKDLVKDAVGEALKSQLPGAIKTNVGAQLPVTGEGGSWFTGLAGLVGTAAGGPAGGALATGAASVGVFLYRRRRRRKQEEEQKEKTAKLYGLIEEQKTAIARQNQQVTDPTPSGPLPGESVTGSISTAPVTLAPPIAWQNVDNGLYAKAHDEARRVIGSRYPGAQEILEAELSLTRQYLSGTVPLPNTQPTRN